MGSGRNLQRKRKYHSGNQFTNKKATTENVDKNNKNPQPSSACSSKEKISQPTESISEDTD